MQRLIEQLQRREVQSARSGACRWRRSRARACERCAVRAAACRRAAAMDDDVWVEADPERLTMIVEHVIRNAQDATPRGRHGERGA